jgi:N-acetylneuraminic acid mutarotase
VLAAMPVAGARPAAGWEQGVPMPLPRGEVAAAVVGGEIAIVGGFVAGGANSAQVDAYSPARDSWRSLPPLPVSVDHAAAAGYRGKLYVAGGYGRDRAPLRTTFVLERGRWRKLPDMPAERAAAGAAVVAGKLYVVGGVGPPAGLALTAFALDLTRNRWSRVPGPTPRQHLAVTAAGGRVYALAGRRAGFDTNLRIFQSYTPGARSWRTLPPVPEPRGGTGAAAVGNLIVSAGGEEVAGTIRTVYAFELGKRRWRRLPDLPTSRHGLGVAAALGRVYVIAGGRQPGLAVSGVNEFLRP